MPTMLGNMLKEQMNNSLKFAEETKSNPVGEDFEQVCNQLLYSDSISTLFLEYYKTVRHSDDGVEISLFKLAASGKDVKGKIGRAVKENIRCFMLPLAMFYWGMKIGRKLEQNVNKNMEGLDEALKDLKIENPPTEEK